MTGVLFPPPQDVQDRATVSTMAPQGFMACRRRVRIAAKPTKANMTTSQISRCMSRMLPVGGTVILRSEIRLGAVVLTVTVAEAELDPLRDTDVGEIEHVASEGAPLHAKLMVPFKPPSGAMLKSYVAVPPAATLAVEAAGAIEKSVPFPESVTVCCPPGTLSVMVMVPLREPVAVGVNVTLIEQPALGATALLQSLV